MGIAFAKPTTSGGPPAARNDPAFCAHPNGLLYFYGGNLASGQASDLWSWNPVTDTWAQVTTVHNPGAIADFVMGYDPVSAKIVGFGGYNGSVSNALTWAIDPTAGTPDWTQLTPGTSPLLRSEHRMFTHPTNGQLCIYGGNNNNSTFYDDLWTWTGTTWSELSTAVTGTGRTAPQVCTADGVVIINGGKTSSANLSDTWTWNGTTATQQTPNTVPTARSYGAIVYSPTRGQVLMLGGGNFAATTLFSDVWIWNGYDWTLVTPTGSSMGAWAAQGIVWHSGTGQIVQAFGYSTVAAALSNAVFTINFGPTITHVQTVRAAGTNQATVAITPRAVGNLVTVKNAIVDTSSATVSGTTDTGMTPVSGVGAWVRTVAAAYDPSIYGRTEHWSATVNGGVGSSQTVTLAYSATPGTVTEVIIDEWNSGLGSTTVWAVVAPNTEVSATNVTTCTFPSVTTTAAGELYEGYAFCSSGSAGSTAGFTYNVTAFDNVVTWNTTCAATTAEQPTCPMSSGKYSSVAAVFSASAPAPLTGTAAVASKSSGTLRGKAALSGTAVVLSVAKASLVGPPGIIGSAHAYSSALGSFATAALPQPATILATPLLSALAQLDPISGLPEIVLTAESLQAFNLLPPVDASFETGIGSAIAVANCFVMRSNAQAADGSYSLAIISLAAGNMVVREGPYPVDPDTLYSWTAAYRAAVNGRLVSVSLQWLDDNGNPISTVTGSTLDDDPSQWSIISPFQKATSPSNAVAATLLHTVAGAAAPLAVPAEPTVTPAGTTGSTTWHYGITAYNAEGETTLSAVRTITNGNATLNGSNYNAVSWAADSGATGYNLYRSPAAIWADIAGDFPNWAAVLGAFSTYAGLLTYVPELLYVGTTTGTTLPDTGLTAQARVAPSVNMSGEAHYLDEVGIFEGSVNEWVNAQAGGVWILRSDGVYVLGASPLTPLELGSAPDTDSVIDYSAAYGLPVTYTAILVAGQLTSSPSVPTDPVVMGQAPDTVALYNRLGWAADEDSSGALLQWLAGIGQMLQRIDSISRDSYDTDGNIAPSWSTVLDINRAPTSVLPWLGQFVGVRVDPSARDDQQRYAIEMEAGFARGTVAAILAAAAKYLLPGYSATITERDTSPYHLTITIPSAGVVGPSTWRSLVLSEPTWADVRADYATYGALWDSIVPIQNALADAIPAGLVAELVFS